MLAEKLMYSVVTRSICVTATPEYQEHQSSPVDGYYVWSYSIHIKNTGSETVRLITRHWRIIDANGTVTEVDGDGVVGTQPLLAPGEEFAYTSGTHLSTPSGIMMGKYGMQSGEGELFQIDIPAFSLDSPEATPLMN